MFDTRTRLFFFACLEDAAGARAALKKAALAPGSDPKKNWLRLRSRPKSGGSRWLRLRNTADSWISCLKFTQILTNNITITSRYKYNSYEQLLYTSLFFYFSEMSKKVMKHTFAWLTGMRLKVKLEPELDREPGQSDGSSSSQIPRLRLRNPV